jgi:hypothetical protein
LRSAFIVFFFFSTSNQNLKNYFSFYNKEEIFEVWYYKIYENLI